MKIIFLIFCFNSNITTDYYIYDGKFERISEERYCEFYQECNTETQVVTTKTFKQ